MFRTVVPFIMDYSRAVRRNAKSHSSCTVYRNQVGQYAVALAPVQESGFH